MKQRGGNVKLNLFETLKSRYFLYLEKKEYTSSWVNGGSIPLNMASKYKNIEREGTNTPDELTQRTVQGIIDMEKFKRVINISDDLLSDSTGPYIHISGKVVQLGEEIVAKDLLIHQEIEDVLILCFSTKLDSKIARRLNKNFCVEIINLNKMKFELDKAINVRGINGVCEYTMTKERNHFLKSQKDSWQKEYRIIWKGVKNGVCVNIPPGLCKEVEIQ